MNSGDRARTADRRYYGVAEAIVTDINDPEKEGRVKLKFPWFDPGMETDWCRVAQAYAGSGFGQFWVPEVDTEVLVSFIHGDMRKPVVVGGLYNGIDKPATYHDNSRDEKMIRTKGGHELVFVDTSGQAKVTLKTAGGHKITLDDTAGTVSIESASGQSVKLDSSGVAIQGTASVTVSAPAIKLGSAAASSLVLGEALLAAFNAHTHNCTAPGSPSGPPVPPMTNAVLSTVSKTG